MHARRLEQHFNLGKARKAALVSVLLLMQRDRNGPPRKLPTRKKPCLLTMTGVPDMGSGTP